MDEPRYLVPHLYTADPSAHVFDGKLYIYPSHDVESEVPLNDNGDHFNMRDYHVFSMETIEGDVTDHGKALDIKDVPWAGRQMWAPDCACRDETYYFYFPAKDQDDLFRIGVATSKSPQGPFLPQKTPIQGSYSIDPCVFEDDDGTHYMYFGGIWGGQLQHYRDNKPIENGGEPPCDDPALCPKVARMSDSMLDFDEPPRDALIVDSHGQPLKSGDHDRRFFEAAWLHKFKSKYYFSYSTGNTHKICYATGDNPYGPFVYQGVLLTPVIGWTTHHSICKFKGKWYLFYHDSRPSNGTTWLRSIKVAELHYKSDGTIESVSGEI